MSDTIPCVTLPSLSGIPKIPLLGGAELRGIVDASRGPVTDCQVNMSLLVQLAPYLANLACVIKLMNVIAKIKDFANAATDPINKLPGAVPALVDSINQLQGCIPFLVPLDLLAMLKAILQMVITFLNCLVSQIAGVLAFEATLDPSATGDNDTLRGVLECARTNADAALSSLKQAIDPLQPILQMVSVIADIAGQPMAIALPDLSTIEAGADASQALQPLKDAIAGIEAIVDAIPG
jgi:hypothetical protein